MSVKATVFTLLLLLGSLAVAGAQQSSAEPASSPRDQATPALQMTPERHATLTKGGMVPNGMMPSAGEDTPNVAIGWHYGQAGNCYSTGGFVYVFTIQGEVLFTNIPSIYTLMSAACTLGHWIGWHVIAIDGTYDALITYDF